MTIEYVKVEKRHRNRKYPIYLLLMGSGFHFLNFNSLVFALFFFDTILTIIWFFIVQFVIIRYVIYKSITVNTINMLQLVLLLTTLFFIGWNNLFFWILLSLQLYNYIYLNRLKAIL